MSYFMRGDVVKFDDDMDIVKASKLSEAQAVVFYVDDSHEWEVFLKLVGLKGYEGYSAGIDTGQGYLQDTRKDKYNECT